MSKNKNRKNAVSDVDAQNTLASIEIPVTIEMKVDVPTVEKTENEKLLETMEEKQLTLKMSIDTWTGNTKEKIKAIRERNNLEVKVLNLQEKIRKEKENGSKVGSNGRYTRVNGIVDAIKALDYTFKSDLSDLIDKSDELFVNAREGNQSSKVLVKRWIVFIVPSLIQLSFASEKDGVITVSRGSFEEQK